MDLPQPAERFSVSKWRRVRIVVVLLVVLVSFGVSSLIRSRNVAPEPTFAWLQPAQFARQMRPGRLKLLYYKALNFTAPVWQRFRSPKTSVVIDSKIFAVHGATIGQLALGTATGTNESGVQAWVLSASELRDLRQHIQTLKGADLVSAPRVTLADGTSASVTFGQSYPPPMGFVGLAVNVTPKIAAHQFQLAMSAAYSELNQGTGTNPIQTNLCAACRVRVPNAGGLLITGPEITESGRTNYWLILSPTAVDGAGNPIKL
jgi:hypothetical protein